MRQRMCLLHNFMQSSLCILTKEQIRIVKFNADFLATMLKINTQIPTGCRNNAQSTQSQSPAILSQSRLGNQKPNPYNGENKSGGTHANHDKGKKKGRAAPWPQRPGGRKGQPSAAASVYPGDHRLYPVQLYTDGSRSHHSVQELQVLQGHPRQRLVRPCKLQVDHPVRRA